MVSVPVFSFDNRRLSSSLFDACSVPVAQLLSTAKSPRSRFISTVSGDVVEEADSVAVTMEEKTTVDLYMKAGAVVDCAASASVNEVDYFPSRYTPTRQTERVPIPNVLVTGRREKVVIEKVDNFKQAGDRYRSWAPDRQERFLRRWVEALSDPRMTMEIRSIWVSYWTQANRSFGQKLAFRIDVRSTM